jgi:hypothetical protein
MPVRERVRVYQRGRHWSLSELGDGVGENGRAGYRVGSIVVAPAAPGATGSDGRSPCMGWMVGCIGCTGG